jgi:hypothetical protein
MPFIGVPVITQVTDRTCLITGVQVAPANGSGTIGVAGSGADIQLPASFIATSYTYQGVTVDLSMCLEVLIHPISALGLTNLAPSVQFSGTLTGTNPASLRITVINTSASLNTQTLSIQVSFLGGGKVTQPARIGP